MIQALLGHFYTKALSSPLQERQDLLQEGECAGSKLSPNDVDENLSEVLT